MCGAADATLYWLYEWDALRLVAPRNDPQYEAWFRQRSENLTGYNELAGLLGPSLAVCVALLALRAVWFRWSCSAHKDLADKAADGHVAWAEGCWTLVGGTVLLVWSWTCVVLSNGGCPSLSFLSTAAGQSHEAAAAAAGGATSLSQPGLLRLLPDTSRCLAGWPLLPMEPAVRLYYAFELAWYLQLLVKHRLGLGLHDSPMLVVHHVASVYLILVSYCFSLHRAGVLMLALLNASTPLLHLSKTAHRTGHRRLALGSFACFALVFALSRVVLFPVVMLPIGLLEPRRHIPHVLRDYPVTWGLVNAVLVLFAAMQWAWFAAVVRVLRHAASGDGARLDKSAGVLERRKGEQEQQEQPEGKQGRPGKQGKQEEQTQLDRSVGAAEAQGRYTAANQRVHAIAPARVGGGTARVVEDGAGQVAGSCKEAGHEVPVRVFVGRRAGRLHCSASWAPGDVAATAGDVATMARRAGLPAAGSAAALTVSGAEESSSSSSSCSDGSMRSHRCSSASTDGMASAACTEAAGVDWGPDSATCRQGRGSE